MLPMRDDNEQTNEQLKIELLSQWKLEAESRKSLSWKWSVVTVAHWWPSLQLSPSRKVLKIAQFWDVCASCWYWPVGQTEERGASYAAPSPTARALSCPYVSLFVPANPNAARPVGGIRAGHAYASICPLPCNHLSCALHTQTSCCGWQLLHQRQQTHKNMQKSFSAIFPKYIWENIAFKFLGAKIISWCNFFLQAAQADTGCTWGGVGQVALNWTWLLNTSSWSAKWTVENRIFWF